MEAWKMSEQNKLEWWGYLHENGNIQVKRYFGPLDIQEAEESPFVQRACGPFLAADRDDARRIVAESLK